MLSGAAEVKDDCLIRALQEIHVVVLDLGFLQTSKEMGQQERRNLKVKTAPPESPNLSLHA